MFSSFFTVQTIEKRSANISTRRKSTILTPNVVKQHLDKVIGRKTALLLIIAQVFGHTASKTRHCSTFELKSQVIKTFISLLKFILNVRKV